jgi:hypothetical protein
VCLTGKSSLWHEVPRAHRSEVLSRVPLRFARVRVAEEMHAKAMIVRVVFANGRRAEIEVSQSDQLHEVLCALERMP